VWTPPQPWQGVVLLGGSQTNPVELPPHDFSSQEKNPWLFGLFQVIDGFVSFVDGCLKAPGGNVKFF
jgi:hypothetical protein